MLKRPRVTQKDIELVHALTSAGLNANRIKDIVKKSHSTVTVMAKAKDLQDYQNIVREMHKVRLVKEVRRTDPFSNTNGQESIDEPSIADDHDLVAWRKQVISQQNTIIAVLKAIEYKL